jgi:glucosamine--fructose-6-phosphate aminotransferase (isomerizing)
VVHNGIIENYLPIKRELIEAGHTFKSETDTEVIAHLVWQNRQRGLGLEDAVRESVSRLVGAYSVVVVDAESPGMLVAARLASPLVLGLGEGQNFVASDIPAILSHTRRMVFLEDGVMATVKADSVVVRRITDGVEVPFQERTIAWSPTLAEKGGYKHFMLKEIHEQPDAVANTLRGRVSLERLAVDLPELGLDAATLEGISRIYVVACGTSWHAGMVGRYLMEELAGLSPHVELASELRYRRAPMDERTLLIPVSQSGETADTLAALKDAKSRGARVLSICNVMEASIPRASDGTLYTHAGPEISVASTKAFSTQVAALHMLALYFGRLLGRLDDHTMRTELEGLVSAAASMERMLQHDEPYLLAARAWHEARSMLFLGRGALYPLALEGALKLKEISYIHAEGYAAGEMKHGPIALIEFSTINAKVENLAKAATWRGPWQRGQRCLFPAAGFYEWQVQADGTKRPPLHPSGGRRRAVQHRRHLRQQHHRGWATDPELRHHHHAGERAAGRDTQHQAAHAADHPAPRGGRLAVGLRGGGRRPARALPGGRHARASREHTREHATEQRCHADRTGRGELNARPGTRGRCSRPAHSALCGVVIHDDVCNTRACPSRGNFFLPYFTLLTTTLVINKAVIYQ